MTALNEQFSITPERVANVVAFAIDQPEDTNINDLQTAQQGNLGNIY